MGRPTKDSEPRSVTLSFRVTETMAEDLQPWRDSRSLSDLLNGLLRAYVAEADQDGEVDPEAIQSAVNILRAIQEDDVE